MFNSSISHFFIPEKKKKKQRERERKKAVSNELEHFNIFNKYDSCTGESKVLRLLRIAKQWPTCDNSLESLVRL